jgi:hypothetical protein
LNQGLFEAGGHLIGAEGRLASRRLGGMIVIEDGRDQLKAEQPGVEPAAQVAGVCEAEWGQGHHAGDPGPIWARFQELAGTRPGAQFLGVDAALEQ